MSKQVNKNKRKQNKNNIPGGKVKKIVLKNKKNNKNKNKTKRNSNNGRNIKRGGYKGKNFIQGYRRPFVSPNQFNPMNEVATNQSYNPVQTVTSPAGTFTQQAGEPRNVSKRTTSVPVMPSGENGGVTSVETLQLTDPPTPQSPLFNWSGELIFKLAMGYWAALRRACFTVGTPGQNDKYVPPYWKKYNYAPDYPVNRMAINFIAQIFCNVHDSIRDGRVPDFAVPVHIMFALQFIAKKLLVQTNTSVVDMGTYATMSPWKLSGDPIPTTRITLAWLQTEKVDAINDGMSDAVDMYNWIANHPKKPFQMTTSFVPESKISLYTKERSGELIYSTMKYEEVASVYGFCQKVSTPSDYYYDNYDYSGISQPSSTNHFRTMFYVQQDNPIVSIPGVASPIKLKYQYSNPDIAILNYCMTGFVVTAERVFTARMPWPGDTSDYVNKFTTSLFLDNVKKLVAANNKGITFGVDDQTYNAGLVLAQALQTKTNNFLIYDNIMTMSEPTNKYNVTDGILMMAVATAQFLERVPLPSPIFEELKSISDIKVWTYEGVSEPVACYYAPPFPGPYDVALTFGTADPDPGVQINRFFTAIQALTTQLLPYRSFLRLNHAPEIGSYMPNMHLYYTDGVKVFTPLDSSTFDQRDIAVFLNYTLMPVVTSLMPMPMNFLVVKTVNITSVINNLSSLSIDFSTNTNMGSEVDEYYRLLRMKHIGFWGALAGVLGAALPKVIDLASNLFKPTEKTKEKVNGTIDNVANGSQLVHSVLAGIINHIDSKQIGITGGRPSKFRKVLGLAHNGLGMVANLRDIKMQ